MHVHHWGVLFDQVILVMHLKNLSCNLNALCICTELVIYNDLGVDIRLQHTE